MSFDLAGIKSAANVVASPNSPNSNTFDDIERNSMLNDPRARKLVLSLFLVL